MTLLEARSAAAALVPGSTISVDERPMVVSQVTQGSIEFHPPGHPDACFSRISIESLASRIVAGQASVIV